MNIQDRLRHCAKHTGLDAVVELLNEAAAHIEGLNSIPKVQGGEPVPFLLNGTRFKMSFQTDLDADLDPITTLTCFNNFQNQLDGRWVALVAAEDDVHLKLSTPQPAQATQAEVTDADIDAVTIQQWGDQRGAPLQAHRAYARAILALRPVQSGLTGCNCRWDGDTQVQWCELHLAHKEAIHEWAERAKEAEKQLALRPAAVPMTQREIELIDGMIEVQLDHAQRCDAIGNRVMGEKQKGWDMERVELLRRIKSIGITAQAKKDTP